VPDGLSVLAAYEPAGLPSCPLPLLAASTTVPAAGAMPAAAWVWPPGPATDTFADTWCRTQSLAERSGSCRWHAGLAGVVRAQAGNSDSSSRDP
jgi:hypothetical protein